MSESTPSSLNCVGPASPSPASPPDETTRDGGDVMSQSLTSQTVLKAVRLTEQDYACLPTDTCKLLRAQDKYITCLEERLNSLEGELSNFREGEERLRAQHAESQQREKVLVRRLAAKEQEMQDVAAQMAELKTSQTATTSGLRSALLDPAVNILLQRLRHELLTSRTRLDETQNELSAWKFTPDSNTGKRLMAKCRLLYTENEELGKLTNSGRVAKLEGELALQKSFSEEVKKSQSELDEFLQDLDEDVEGMQSTIYYLQQELRKTKDTVTIMERELQTLRQQQSSTSGTTLVATTTTTTTLSSSSSSSISSTSMPVLSSSVVVNHQNVNKLKSTDDLIINNNNDLVTDSSSSVTTNTNTSSPPNTIATIVNNNNKSMNNPLNNNHPTTPTPAQEQTITTNGNSNKKSSDSSSSDRTNSRVTTTTTTTTNDGGRLCDSDSEPELIIKVSDKEICDDDSRDLMMMMNNQTTDNNNDDRTNVAAIGGVLLQVNGGGGGGGEVDGSGCNIVISDGSSSKHNNKRTYDSSDSSGGESCSNNDDVLVVKNNLSTKCTNNVNKKVRRSSVLSLEYNDDEDALIISTNGDGTISDAD